jgi:hypothetical protein
MKKFFLPCALVFLLVLASLSVKADPPGPPGPGGNPGGTGGVPVGSPIDGGLTLLLALGLGYGGVKLHRSNTAAGNEDGPGGK